MAEPGDYHLRHSIFVGLCHQQQNTREPLFAGIPRLSDALVTLEAGETTLVLLDLDLPDSHGAETFRRIRQKAPSVPIVIPSGRDDEALATEAVQQCVQDYLFKSELTSQKLERAHRYAVERQELLP